MNPQRARKVWIAAACLAAAPVHAAEFWTTTTTIQQIYPTSAGLTIMTAYSNPISTCDSGRRWLIPLGAANYKVLAANAMMAFAQGYRITLHVEDQAPSCEPTVDRFILDK